MDEKAFDEFLEVQIEHIRSKLKVKGAEYVPGSETVSRFHNFEVGAALNNESIEKTLWGFVTKHLVSLSDMVKVNSTDYDIEVWDEKIGDVILYMLLLHGMVTHTDNVVKQIKESLMEAARESMDRRAEPAPDLAYLPQEEVVVTDNVPQTPREKRDAWLNKVTPLPTAPWAKFVRIY